MTGEALPDSLDTACHRFSKFLRDNGYPEQILFVEREDVVWDGLKCWIHESSNAAQERARARYSEGIRRGFGVAL